MGIGVGLLLTAVGAVLTFAVDATVSGLNIHTVGVILMVVGVAGILLDLVVFAPRRRTVAVAPAGTRRTVVQENESVY